MLLFGELLKDVIALDSEIQQRVIGRRERGQGRDLCGEGALRLAGILGSWVLLRSLVSVCRK